MYSTDLDVQVTQVLTANFIRRLKRGAWKFSLGQCWTREAFDITIFGKALAVTDIAHRL